MSIHKRYRFYHFIRGHYGIEVCFDIEENRNKRRNRSLTFVFVLGVVTRLIFRLDI